MPEDISEFVDYEKVEYTYYDKDANIITENVEVSCAYIAIVNDKKTYYIKTLRGSLFDPEGMDSQKINTVLIKFSKVEKETFDFYVDYLKTKQRNSLTWAERSNVDV
jgi:hypothetical protein|tara:strand:+ start:1157 stop:1477 length:321 start_codon:yes stop_codon:yes gene_type:complete